MCHEVLPVFFLLMSSRAGLLRTFAQGLAQVAVAKIGPTRQDFAA
jgi:hypothetical protein